MPRVAITGAGVICALGRNTEEFARAFYKGRSAVAAIKGSNMSQPRFSNGAQVRGYDHSPQFGNRGADFLDRFAQFALIVARQAVSDAKITWTPDLKEKATAIHSVFGKQAGRIAVSSTKSLHGHALGAAAALEAAATIFALRDGVLPPAANFLAPDPDCDLDVIATEARVTQVSNSFAFGGTNVQCWPSVRLRRGAR